MTVLRRARIAFRILVRRQFEISWQMPKAVELVIWDEVDSNIFLALLDPASQHIIRVRDHPLYLHPLILWETLISGLTKRNTHHGVVIERCRPKMVVTFIDNNPRFHKLANKLPDIRFLAIQSGIRHRSSDQSQAIGLSATYNSEYLCFGQFEIDYYRSIGYKFKHIRGMGSLKNALFARDLHESKKGLGASEKGDILLISQFRKAAMEPLTQSQSRYVKVVSLLNSYLESHPGLQVSVAMVCAPDQSDYEAERLFHQERLGNLATLTPNSEEWTSSYHLTEQFSVVVTASSTLGFETLGRGRKAMICDERLSRTFVDQTFTPDWILSRFDQEIFDGACTKLLTMPSEEFILRNRKSINYFMLSSQEDSIAKFQRAIIG